LSGDLLGVEVRVEVGDGSKQISPNHALEVHEWLLIVVVGAVELGMAGGDVMGWEFVGVGFTSLQPQKTPGVSHIDDVVSGVVATVVGVGSRHPPKNPLLWHVVELVGDVIVAVGFDVLLFVVVVVTSSLHPNQPGVLQVEVEVVVMLLLVDVLPEVVVVSSKHPHHPGVWQVEVRVCDRVVEVGTVVAVLLFPVTSFHSGQS
jgi:hypothetical protein